MRLDLFLKASRLVPRRSVAKLMCDEGMVSVNEIAARSSREVRPGDLITIRRRTRESIYRVEAIPPSKQTSKAAAPALTSLVSETAIADDLLS